MPAQRSAKLLLIGATGYVGGTVLMTLLNSTHYSVKAFSITALVQNREETYALSNLGITIVPFQGPYDITTLTAMAAQHDIVVNTEVDFPQQSTVALIGGLAERKRRTAGDVVYIHTSSTTNLADAAPREEVMIPLSDLRNDIPSVEAILNTKRPFPPRSTDLAVLNNCAASSVRPFIIMPPEIYGIGADPTARGSHQIDKLALDALREGCPTMVGEGFGEVGHIHVEDLAALYELLLARLLNGWQVMPGVYFCSGGLHMWRNVAHLIGRVGVSMGSLEASLPIGLTEKEATRRWTGGDHQELRRLYCCSFDTKPDKARALGWEPKKGEDDWGNWVVTSTQSVLGSMRNQ